MAGVLYKSNRPNTSGHLRVWEGPLDVEALTALYGPDDPRILLPEHNWPHGSYLIWDEGDDSPRWVQSFPGGKEQWEAAHADPEDAPPPAPKTSAAGRPVPTTVSNSDAHTAAYAVEPDPRTEKMEKLVEEQATERAELMGNEPVELATRKPAGQKKGGK